MKTNNTQNYEKARDAATYLLSPYVPSFVEPCDLEPDSDGITLTVRSTLDLDKLPKAIRADAKRVARTYPDTSFWVEANISLATGLPIALIAYEQDTQWQCPLPIQAMTQDQKIALVRTLASSIKDDLICELNRECLINPEEAKVVDNTRDMPTYAQVAPYIILFALYPNDLDPSGHFLPSQAIDAHVWESAVRANPSQYPDSYVWDYGVIHEPINLAIAVDATTASHCRVNLYLDKEGDGMTIITYCMSYAVAMQVAAHPFDFFDFVQGQVRARREGKLPSGVGVEWDYVPSIA